MTEITPASELAPNVVSTHTAPSSKDHYKNRSYVKTVQHPSAEHFQHDPVRVAKKIFLDEEMRQIGSDPATRANQHVLIRLTNEEDFSRIWLRGEWTFDSFHMRVFKWSPTFDPHIESSIAPLWIRLHDLPIHLFEKNALFTLAAKIGKPLRMDEPMTDMSRPDLARVCVEIDLTALKVQAVFLHIEGKTYRQLVIYENCPPYCTSCNHLGHEISACIAKLHNDITHTDTDPRPPDARVVLPTSTHDNDANANVVSFPPLHGSEPKLPVNPIPFHLRHVEVATPDDFNFEDPLIAELLDRDWDAENKS
ncbi:UNVERIFIED_CONTAM: hypothetical protein Slati_3764200 [Sesamum latifolium]|uniref:DUF4283 domain-containing protein n=1 Tax=Sesamum latifolium TaxID=2727402 RepID=A0AAW2U398_9LAMI